ncbi:ferric enterobactin receptor [Stenotrophomonas maltophilia]|nr:ferric enterobactin receptor [Stenotrophomonas maltophilia]
MPAAYAPALSTLAVLIAAALAATPSHAAEADADPATTAATANVAASTLDAVVVTGSRTSTRTVKNSSTPIDVISAEDLVLPGRATCWKRCSAACRR